MNITYKKATTSDVKIIADLADKIWKKHYIDIISMDQIEYMLNKMYSEDCLAQQIKDGHEFTIVYIDNQPEGYISISSKDSKNYLLHKFYINSDQQSKGIGTRLFNDILKQLKTAETIELAVNRRNYRSINFYFKNGFTIKNVNDLDIGNGYSMDDFIMIKKIK
jgi:GNAT superfamily N-acetyltransferase